MVQRNSLDAERKAMQSALEAAEKNYLACKDELTGLSASAQELKKQLTESAEIDIQAQQEEKDALSLQKAAVLKEQKAVHARIASNTSCRKNIRSKSAELSQRGQQKHPNKHQQGKVPLFSA